MNIGPFATFVLAAACVAVTLHARAQTPPPPDEPRAPKIQPTAKRWVNASGVNLRTEPKASGAVVATFPLNAEVDLIGVSTTNPSFCEMKEETTGARGFMACRYLAMAEVPTTAASRWISASNVNLRAEPSAKAAVVGKLGVNAHVRLLGESRGDDQAFCEVKTLSGRDADVIEGFVACEYLAMTPLDAQTLLMPDRGDGTPNPDFDPIKAFRLAPSWAALEARAIQLERMHLPRAVDAEASDRRRQARRPADPELERMKEHLAKGLRGSSPEARLPWSDVRRLAQQQPHELSGLLGLWGPLFDSWREHGRSAATALVDAIELPSVGPSWFEQDTDIASFRDRVDQVGTRFDILHIIKANPRAKPSQEIAGDGVWDMGSRTTALLKPVHVTTVFRDGRLRGVASTLASREELWGEGEPPMCHGFEGGFALGDADPRIWLYDVVGGQAPHVSRRAKGSLVRLTTKKALPIQRATPKTTVIELDRSRTGFVRATQMHFDLDGDGVLDLVAWEGVGKGPGHLGGETTTDDAWHRIFFVNIAGQWMLLGTDQFAYGCGC